NMNASRRPRRAKIVIRHDPTKMRLKKPGLDLDTSQINPRHRTVTMETVAQARTAGNKVAFLEQFKVAGTITAACRAAGINRATHYDWLDRDPQYVKDFEEAKEVRVELLETEMRRRALVGWDEPVYQGGKLVGHIRKFSDTLLIFALKAERPEKYRERYQ